MLSPVNGSQIPTSSIPESTANVKAARMGKTAGEAKILTSIILDQHAQSVNPHQPTKDVLVNAIGDTKGAVLLTSQTSQKLGLLKLSDAAKFYPSSSKTGG